MAAPKSEFKKYLDQTQALPPDVVLGWIVIFQVRDGEYDRNIMERTFEELSMNPNLLPARNNPLHAFQKATSSVNDADYDLPNEEVAHVLVRDARADKEMVVRHLTREIRDRRRGRLGYSKIGECVFYRPKTVSGKVQYGSERVRLDVDHSALKDHERPALQGIIDRMAREYDRHLNYIDSMKYRAVIRDYLLFLNALKIKDGFYFVHSNRLDELEKLRTLVERMGNGTTLWMMPLVDLGEQKKMVIQAYETEAEEAYQDVIKQIAHIRGTRKSVTPDAFAKVGEQYKLAKAKADEYRRVLKVRTAMQSGAEETAQEMLVALREDLLKAAS